MAFVSGLMAMVSSLCLGLGFGHSALGRPLRGFVWLAVFITLVVLTTFWFQLLAVAALAWLGGLADAFLCGYRSNQEPPFRWLRVSTVSITVVSVAFAVVLRLWLVASFKMPSSSMYPTIEIGDHVLVRQIATVHRGDLIVHRYPCDTTREYAKRVIALGGDSVEVRCNVLYVNGKVVQSHLVAEQAEYKDRDERSGQWFPRRASRYRETLGDATYDIFDELDRPEVEKQGDRTRGSMRDFPMRSSPQPPSCLEADDGPGTNQLGRLVETKREYEVPACAQQLQYVVPAGHVFVMGDNRANSNDSRVWGSVPLDEVTGRVVGIWWTDRPGASLRSRLGSVR